jgi:hypothetical protein
MNWFLLRFFNYTRKSFTMLLKKPATSLLSAAFAAFLLAGCTSPAGAGEPALNATEPEITSTISPEYSTAADDDETEDIDEDESLSADYQESEDEETTAPQVEVSELGTRQNPLPFGTEITEGDWTVVINSVTSAPEMTSRAGTTWTPTESDHVFLVIDLSITNNSDTAQRPGFRIGLLTHDSALYASPAITMHENEIRFLDTIRAGRTSTGIHPVVVALEDIETGLLSIQTQRFGGDQIFMQLPHNIVGE